jgi:hypothetical protein
VSDLLKNAVTSRLAGDRPSPFKAAVVSAVAGAAAAAMTYRVLRS